MTHTARDVAIEVRNLTRVFPGKGPGQAVKANDDLSFSIPRGQVFGLLGPNGAGKTTLVSQLLGLVRPTSGEILVEGIDAVNRPDEVKAITGFLPQTGLSMRLVEVRRALHYTGRLRGQSEADARRQTAELIEELGLGQVADRYVNQLSGGMTRLVNFGMALMGRPKLLILDEPTNELDPHNRRLVWDMVSERSAADGTTVVLVTHNVLEAETAVDQVAVMNGGRITAMGTPGHLKEALGDRIRLELFIKDGRELTPYERGVFEAVGSVDKGKRDGSYLVHSDSERMPELMRAVYSGVGMDQLADFRLTRPTLEDVYLTLDGRGGPAFPEQPPAGSGRTTPGTQATSDALTVPGTQATSDALTVPGTRTASDVRTSSVPASVLASTPSAPDATAAEAEVAPETGLEAGPEADSYDDLESCSRHLRRTPGPAPKPGPASGAAGNTGPAGNTGSAGSPAGVASAGTTGSTAPAGTATLTAPAPALAPATTLTAVADHAPAPTPVAALTAVADPALPPRAAARAAASPAVTPAAGAGPRLRRMGVGLKYLWLEQMLEVRTTWTWVLMFGLLMPSAMVFGLTRIGNGLSDPESLLFIVSGAAIFSVANEGIGTLAQRIGVLRNDGMMVYYASLPISKIAFLAAMVFSRLLLILPGLITPMITAKLMYDVDFVISPVLLIVLPLSCMALSAIGLAIGTLVRNMDLLIVITNLMIFVLLLVAPVLIPIESLPVPLQVFGYLLPPTYAAESLRLALAGDLGTAFLLNTAVLAAMTAGGLAGAARWIRWRTA